MTFITILFLLLAAHALCDIPLQSDFMAQQKSPWCQQPLQKGFWVWCLTWHALIHGGAVYLITHNLWLGLAEFACHWIIDILKCAGKLGIHTDQSLHVGCKAAWASLL